LSLLLLQGLQAHRRPNAAVSHQGRGPSSLHACPHLSPRCLCLERLCLCLEHLQPRGCVVVVIHWPLHRHLVHGRGCSKSCSRRLFPPPRQQSLGGFSGFCLRCDEMSPNLVPKGCSGTKGCSLVLLYRYKEDTVVQSVGRAI
jgi:hypothetical protein